MSIGHSRHSEEAGALKRRAFEFLDLAREAMKRGAYDVSCFLSEQAAQMRVKSILLEYVGDYPRIHSIRALLEEVVKSRENDALKKFLQKNRIRLVALEDAYIISRYTPSEYTKEDAEDFIHLVDEIMSLIEGVTRK
jgi:HEPN domain-containing protein